MWYQLTRDAYSDIENIWEYSYNNWSKEQADKYINLILSEIEYLSKNPNLGRHSYISEYFKFQVKSHFIFYEILNSDLIEITRILHQSMDFELRLK